MSAAKAKQKPPGKRRRFILLNPSSARVEFDDYEQACQVAMDLAKKEGVPLRVCEVVAAVDVKFTLKEAER